MSYLRTAAHRGYTGWSPCGGVSRHKKDNLPEMRTLLLTLIFCASAALPAQTWNLVPFGPDSGLPRGTTDRVSAEETGAVLARTGGNWYRFDGSDFRPRSGTAGGSDYRRWAAGRHPRCTLNERLPGIALLAATTDRQGRWWLATDRGLFRAVPTPFRSYGGRRDWTTSGYDSADGNGRLT